MDLWQVPVAIRRKMNHQRNIKNVCAVPEKSNLPHKSVRNVKLQLVKKERPEKESKVNYLSLIFSRNR
jgi:hypothetical protein